MIRKLAQSSLLLASLCLCLPAFAQSKGSAKIVDAAVKLRLSPKWGSSDRGVLKLGAAVTVIQVDGAWVMVEGLINGRKRTGWVARKYVQNTTRTSSQANSHNSQSATPKSEVVALRSKTDWSSSSKTGHTIRPGQQVEIIGQQGDWYQVRDSQGHTGWVAKTHMSTSTSTTVHSQGASGALDGISGRKPPKTTTTAQIRDETPSQPTPKAEPMGPQPSTINVGLGDCEDECTDNSEPTDSIKTTGTDAEKYDHYKAIIEAHGGDFDHRNKHVNVLAFRGLKKNGSRSSDADRKADKLQSFLDSIIVVYKDSRGRKHVGLFQCTTTPSARTSQDAPDVDNNGKADYAHLRPGSYLMSVTKKGSGHGYYIRSHNSSSARNVRVDRDTNQDGLISHSERQASQQRQDRSPDIMIHKAPKTYNPGSLGCTTLPPSEWTKFFDMAQEDSDKKWTFTLVNTR